MNYKENGNLIEDLKTGKETAFIYVLNTYSNRLYAYALTLTNNKVISQDIVQNVFLKTWEQRKKINIKTSVLNYLLKCVYNEFINGYKKDKTNSLLEQKYHEALEKVVNEEEDNFSKKAINYITTEIKKLPPKCQEVFILSRKEGLTNIEIANYLNISTKTVEAHISKAFSILKQRIETNFNTFLFLLFSIKKKTY